MKSKLVLWGSNDQDEKLMIAVALRMDENKVDIWTFPESVATEDFYQKMMKEWRDGTGLEFPEPNTHLERELSMSESILPDEIKVERGDVVQRAQTEWHFLVLSSKLHQSYKDRCEELQGHVEKLEKYDQGIWDNLKEFWGKVQGQVRERNLLREHADALRDNINGLFSKMKELRSKMDEEFGQFSKEGHDKLIAALDEIEEKVNKGARLPVMFDELKKLQHRFRETKMTREHRSKVWDKLDATFKDVKKRRFGDRATSNEGGSSPYQRTKRRYDGLISAIGKMQASIKRDKNDLDFQSRRIANTDGQLEAQIRQAKIKMIEERVRSKEEKLNEMNATKIDLEKRMASQKEKEDRRAAQQAAKDKIAEKIKADADARKADEEKLGKAAEKITADKAKKEESIVGAVSATVGESLVNVMDTIKAASVVIGGKIGEAIDEMKEEAGEVIADAKEKAAEIIEDVKEEVAEAKEKAAEVAEEVKEEISEKAAKAKATAKKATSKAKAKAAEIVEDVKEEVAEAKEKAAEVAEEVKEEISEKAVKAKATAKKVTSKAKAKAAEIVEEVKEEISEEEE